MKAKVYSACVNGTFTQVKAFKKSNALARFKQLDESIRMSDIISLSTINSHQSPVEIEYPEICF